LNSITNFRGNDWKYSKYLSQSNILTTPESIKTIAVSVYGRHYFWCKKNRLFIDGVF